MPFPPTAKEKFSLMAHSKRLNRDVDVETHGEGFRMEFPVSGREFHIMIDVPKEAVHGPYMIIFYASFYHKGDPNSLVETGLSYSLKGWNFTAADHNPKHHFDSIFTNDPPLGRSVELVVTFEQHGSSELIHCRAAGHSHLVHRPKYEPVDKMRLVIAAGNDHGASYSEAAMTLRSVDHKPPTRPGFVEFMEGGEINASNRRSVFLGQTGYGMRCRLPAEASVGAPHAAIKGGGAVDSSPARPLSQSELRRLTMMQ